MSGTTLIIAAIVALAVSSCLASSPPSREGSPTSVLMTDNRKLIVTAKDLMVQDGDGVENVVASIRRIKKNIADVKELTMEAAAELEAFMKISDKVRQNSFVLKEVIGNGTSVSEVVSAAIESATGGLLDRLESKQITLEEEVDEVTTNQTAEINGYEQTRSAVARLGIDIDYLLSHANNITLCANNANIHAGDGNCVPPVITCATPSPPRGGSVALSYPNYIIGGVTAEYSCTDNGHLHYFLQGPSTRVCSGETGMFYPAEEPTCAVCRVPACKQCAGVADVCNVCEDGHTLSADKRECTEIKDAVYVLGYSKVNSGHNGWESYKLKEGDAGECCTNKWTTFVPGTNFKDCAGAIVHTTIYTVLRNGVMKYITSDGLDWITRSDMSPSYAASNCCDRPFHALVKGQSAEGDGLYHFAKLGSAVFRPKVGAVEGTWTDLPLHPEGNVWDGATAVVGSKIYLLGGYDNTKKIRIGSVYIWDSTQNDSGDFIVGTPLSTARRSHAAAAFGGKIYVFGGETSAGFVDTGEVFDPSSNTWAALPPMPKKWAYMGTGPMPSFINGDIIIPGAWKIQAFSSSTDRKNYRYNAIDNAWYEDVPLQSTSRWGGRYIVLHGSR